MVRSVLVVDDDAYVRELLSNICAHAGAEVVTASDGEEGLECVKAKRLDLIFVDVRMPVLDGIEFSKKVIQKTPHQRIVLMSGTMIEGDMDKNLKEKVFFLVKPFKVATIQEILSSLK